MTWCEAKPAAENLQKWKAKVDAFNVRLGTERSESTDLGYFSHRSFET